jgi:ABC-type Fe3+-hydroxamate transport system substrate-binding protein
VPKFGRLLCIPRVGRPNHLPRRILASLPLALLIFVFCDSFFAFSGDSIAMKRRQQGILTGMPFMANVAPRTFVDDVGRKIYLAKAPKRVVSLAPSITEILFAIGAGDSVVGVTEFCDYPPEALTKTHVGDSRPNLEAILALEPDLVLAMEVIRDDVLKTLQQLKIPLFILEAKSLEHVYSHVQTVGRMLGRISEANNVAHTMRQDIQAIASKTSSLPKPRVLYVVYPQPFITVGTGSYIHQLLELAGGNNIAKDAGNPYPRLSMEVVLQKDPEIILFPTMGGLNTPEADLDQWKRWSSMSAVKHERLHLVPWALISRPGPRLVQGLEALAKVIHPEIFQES